METFRYTRTWRSPRDLPTVETSEVQVREDMQSLFDEAAEGINALVEEVKRIPAVDESLTAVGAAADAAATGAQFKTLSALVGDVNTALEAILGEEQA